MKHKKIKPVAMSLLLMIFIVLSSCTENFAQNKDRGKDKDIVVFEDDKNSNEDLLNSIKEYNIVDAKTHNNFWYYEENDEITIIRYWHDNTPQDVVFPSVIDGKNVTRISSRIFENYRKKYETPFIPVTTIFIPESITHIEDEAFIGVVDLESFDVSPDNQYYSSLEGVLYNKDQSTLIQYPQAKSGDYEIPEGVTRIKKDAFIHCSDLLTIYIPDSVETIEDGAFIASIIDNISISSDNAHYVIVDNALYDYSMTVLYYCLPFKVSNFIVPEGVEKIADYAFFYSGFATISLPDSLNNIGDKAFIFSNILLKINVSPNNNYFSSMDGVLYNKDQSILISFPSFESGVFEVPSGVKQIANYAFAYSPYMDTIVLPDGLTHIGHGAFTNCNSLYNINIPNTVEYVGDAAFAISYSLENIIIDGDLEYLGNSVFERCDSLKTIRLPDHILFIGDSAFKYCSELEEIEIPHGITTIHKETFYGCRSLRTITLPDGIERIEDRAFVACKSLSSIDIPDTVTHFGIGCFAICESLSSINIPDGVTAINNDSFSDCTSLISVHIPESVIYIGGFSFSNCQSLISVNLPDHLQYIGKHAFEYCSSLEDINIPDAVKYIGCCTFYQCQSLKTISLPEGISTIEEHTFYGCSELMTVAIPDSVTRIDDYAFAHCKSLSRLILSENITHISDNAFEHSNNLVITCPADSYSLEYAMRKNIDHIIE